MRVLYVNGFMMIKHQVELVNVVNLNCPLHGTELSRREIKKRLNKDEDCMSHIGLSSKDDFENNLIKDEAICLCEEQDICDATTIDDDKLYNIDF